MADRLAEALSGGSVWLFPLALIAGLLTSLNPCVYPMLGAVVAYIARYGERSSARSAMVAGAFLLGLVIAYAAMGAAGSFVGPRLGLSPRQLSLVVGGVLILAGLFMADVIPVGLPGISLMGRYWGRLRGYPGAVALGALLGLVATPCATPPLVAILSVATLQRSVLTGVVLLTLYAIGHGLPTIVVAILFGSIAGLGRFARYGQVLQSAGGWILVGLGLYLLWHA